MMLSRQTLSPQGPTFSRMVYGAWRLSDVLSEATAENVARKIHACLEVGMTTFDHADIYGNYTCEALFGEGISRAQIPRHKMEYISKCGIKLVSPNRLQHRLKHYDTSKSHIISSVENSLKNLRTDYLDLLLIHRPDPLLNPDEVAEAFLLLNRTGKVRHFGVSNFTVAQFEMLASRVTEPLVTNQIELSVLHKNPLYDGTVDFCLQKRISPMAWSPLGGGRIFSGTGTRDIGIRNALASIAKQHDHATIEQIALAWLLAHPAHILPVIGSNNTTRIHDSVKAEKIHLTREQWFEIWSASEQGEVP